MSVFLVTCGLLALNAMAPRQAAAGDDFGIHAGVNFLGCDLGVGTSLGFSYGEHDGHSRWGVSLGLSSDPYYHGSYYAYRPAYYYPYRSYPVYYPDYGYGGHSNWSASYRYRDGHHDSWSVGYNYRSGGHGYGYYPAAYGYAPAYWNGGYGYGGGAVAMAVPVVVEDRPVRWSGSERIVRNGPVESNPIMKRVWVPGEYETKDSKRVWVPGHWEYIPDTQ